MRNKSILYFLGAIALFCACEESKQDEPVISNPDPEVEETYLSLSPETELTFNEENPEENIVTITTNASWEATTSASDLKIDKTQGSATVKTIKITDTPAGESRTLTVTTIPNAGENPISKKVTIKRNAIAPPPPVVEQTIIYYNDFDKEKAEKMSSGYYPYLNQSECWKNETGTGITSVTYSINNSDISVRSNWTSNSNNTDQYTNPSGVNNLYFNKTTSSFAIENISVSNEKNFILSFGSSVNKTAFAQTDLTVEVGDGNSWKKLEYTRDFSHSKWDLTVAEFSLTNSVDKLYFRFSAGSTANQLRIDDVKLTNGNPSSQIFTFDNVNYPLAELPAYSATDNIITHYEYIASKRVRNYSMLFDADKHAALWIAYPLHSCYLGSSGRTEAWAADPEIPESDQPILNRSYKNGYTRGHQIPSGDRTINDNINAQTFYFSNMTPQESSFNSGIWAELEYKVRTSMMCSDTLYVVTGCHFGNGYESTYDNDYKTCPVPTHYYKVLLRTKNGNTGKAIGECSPNELIAIGFWMDHFGTYESSDLTDDYCVSVEEIENITGFTFFPTVADEVKQQCKPSDWGL